jgi:hypothetical protein
MTTSTTQADPTLQGFQGFGVKPQQSIEQWQLAAALAQMNDSGLIKDLMTTDQPNGRMVGDRFVPPSWTQSLDGAVKQGIGAYQYKQNMDMKKQFMQQMALNANGGGRVGTSFDGLQDPGGMAMPVGLPG